jgi:hypothetical protein
MTGLSRWIPSYERRPTSWLPDFRVGRMTGGLPIRSVIVAHPCVPHLCHKRRFRPGRPLAAGYQNGV